MEFIVIKTGGGMGAGRPELKRREMLREREQFLQLQDYFPFRCHAAIVA